MMQVVQIALVVIHDPVPGKDCFFGGVGGTS